MSDLDEMLRDAGARWRAEQETPAVDVDGAKRPAGQALSVLIVTTAVVVVVVLLVTLLGRDTSSHRRLRVSVTPTTVLATSSVIQLNAAIAQPETLAIDGDRLWVSGYASPTGVSKPAHLQEIAATTGKLIGDVTLPDDSPSGLQIVNGAVWLNGQQREESTELLKVDMATMKIVARYRNIKSGQTAVTPHSVWAMDGVGGLQRIDPATGKVIATIHLPVEGIYPPLWVTAGPGGVWVGNGYDGNVQRIDETTNTAGPIINVAPDMAQLVELNGSLWVGRGLGRQLVQVVGSEVSRRIDLPERTLDLVSDGKALWLGTEGAHVLRVDVNTGAITKVALPAGTSSTVLAADPATGAVWVASMQPTPRLLRVPTETAPSAPGVACSTPSRFGADSAPNEVHGTSANGQLWGLALGPGAVPPRAGDELKIVWRMTGVGPLRVVLTTPDGREQPLVFGPDAHASSTYRRPGDEWGTGLRFSTSGCWHIHLSRDDTSGDVWLNVGK
jgi:hypothetical protein